MSITKFKSIFKEHEDDSPSKGDCALQGLMIIAKYFKDETVLVAAEHDEIFSVGVGELIGRGITDEDIHTLAKLGWRVVSEDYLACFV